MKKRLAMILALVIVASLALVGCGKGGSDKEALVGKWYGDIDITDMVNKEFMKGLGEDAKGLEGFKDLKMGISLEMREDGTYTLAMDEASVNAFMESAKVQTKEIMIAFMEKQLKDMGVEMSAEEAMKAAGISIDDMIDELFGAGGMDISDMVETMEGEYMIKDGKIHFGDGINKPEKVIPNPYKLAGSKLTIEADKVSETDSSLDFMFPLVLEKVK